MSLFERIATAVLKSDVRQFILPEIDINDHTFACKDNSVVTLFRVEGLMSTPGPEEVRKVEEALKRIYATALEGKKHSLSWHFENDPDNTARALEHSMQPARHANEALDLNIGDLIDENIHFLSEGEYGCVYEACYLAAWTHPGAVPGDELKEAFAQTNERRKKSPAVFPDGPDPFGSIDTIVNRHEAFVATLLSDLNASGLHLSIMQRHDAAAVMRQSFNRSASLRWRPALSGDPVPPRERLPGAPTASLSEFCSPPLDWQIGSDPVEPVDGQAGMVKVGDTYYAAALVDLFPYEIHRFHHLFSRIPREIPWAMHMHLGGAADGLYSFRSVLSSFMTVFSPENKLIRKDYLLATEDLLGDGENRHHRCRIQMHFLTWGKSIEITQKNLSRLVQPVEGWGSPTIFVDHAAPNETLIASIPGATYTSPATPSYARSEDVAMFSPVSRPASPWEQGALVFTTPDRKPYPFQPGSGLQTVHIDITFAKPGNGKSVLSNAVNTALILRGGLESLPDITIVDIGPSSAGQANMIRSRLPESRKHEVFAKRIRMTTEDAYNVMDTELGSRFPLPMQREFLRDFLSLLLTAPGEDNPHPEISRLIPLAIDKTYEFFSDTGRGSPRTYQKNMSPEVDAAIEKLVEAGKFTVDEHTIWWEVVDALFAAGDSSNAILAQRFAMPTLGDMTSIVSNNDAIQSQYGDKSGLTIGGGSSESVAAAFARTLSSAARELPLLFSFTKLDLSRAYIKSIDLQDVAPQGSDAATRQTGLMYLMAIAAGTSHYFLDDDYLDFFPEAYRDYHQRRFKAIRRRPKRIVCDELHLAPPAILRLLERLARVGRKYNFMLGLVSQRLTDFPKDLLSMSTTRFILGQLEPSEIEEVKNAFSLSETDCRVLSSNLVHGPRPGVGSAFLMSFVIKENTYSQVVRMRKGPRELWSYSTTEEDGEVRKIVFDILGPIAGLDALCEAYPNASILPEFERRRKNLSDSQEFLSKQASANILDEIASEIVAEYNRSHRQAAAG